MLYLSSSGVCEGRILDRYGIHSKEVKHGVPYYSIPLEWEGEPEGTKAFAIEMMDYDNFQEEGIVWVHWTIADIPKEIHCLEANVSRKLPWLMEGKNSWCIPYGPYEKIEGDVTIGYGGPAPSGLHEYEFTIYALKQKLELLSGFEYNVFRKHVIANAIDKAVLLAVYE